MDRDESLQRSGSARSSRNPSMRLSHVPSPVHSHSHRQSFTEQMRGLPPSPRANRHLSLSQAQIQDLLNNPPTAGTADPAFAGRDWQHISVGELVNQDVTFVELDTGVEAATNLLLESSSPVLLVRTGSSDKAAATTFDYRDLTQYLLFATGQLQPDEERRVFFQSLAKKAQQGQPIPVRDAKNLGTKEPLITLPHTADLTKAVETFGGGVHRIVVVKERTDEVVGILSQLELVKFLWENGRSFPNIDQLYPQTIKDLGIGTQQLISVNGDKPLKEALKLMNDEGVTSLAVVDNGYNVVGNISNVDVKLLTKSSSAPLLENTCIHFITVILSTRGMNDGQDSFPVFHVSPNSTLAHTVAKLVATKAHRIWQNVDHHSSLPLAHKLRPISSTPQAQPPLMHLSTTPSVSASALPGAAMSGRLSGVVSLTDILNLYAKMSGLNPGDLDEVRRMRRRSSSGSVFSERSGRSVSIDRPR
ncbi:MAG: hypothetical protein Q9195_003412 [Heterodermia aff. obscurata]